jgi:hypothetical protein
MDDEHEQDDAQESLPAKSGAKASAWYDTFTASARFAGLSEEQKQRTWDVISFFTEYSAEQIGLGPEEWTPGSVTECCLEVLPRKVSAEADFFEVVAPVLSAFFYYLDDQGLLKRAKALAETVAPLGPRILAAGRDPDLWGPAKTFAMGALRAGVDVGDEAALQAYMLEYNERMVPKSLAASSQPANPPPESQTWQPPAPTRRIGPKVGRNDPCPCGSGKKYKKCCGG